MRSDELFLLINEIDERLIDDAENDVQPEKVMIKSGLPFKEIAAFAACFAVLAAGIFTIIKFKIDGKMPTVSNDPFAVSSEDPSFDESNSDDSSDVSDNSGDFSDNSTVSKPVKEPDMVKDTAFTHIVQPYLKKGSLADTLRGIMLRATTVEELEAAVEAVNKGAVITEVKVTKKPDDGSYSKGGIPVTSGYIDEGMTISVTYIKDMKDGGGLTGVHYIVGSFFDEYYGQIISEGDFPLALEDAIGKAETVAQLRQLIYEVDIHDRVTVIRVYTDSSMTKEVTDGDLKEGMTVYITYDNNNSWVKRNVTGR